MISRVHWLIHNLEREFKREYTLVFDYAFHRYCFYRLKGRKLHDLFIVYRSSKRCWKVSHVNIETAQIQVFSCKKSINVARRMWYIYKLDCNENVK